VSALWNCVEPAKWPSPPEEMTYSTLGTLEACPRRWALQNAEYPGLWEGKGYPPKVVVKGLMGTIVHFVAEVVARELVRAGCTSISDGHAIQVMRALGGYSKLISEGIETTLTRVQKNPRGRIVLEHVQLSLQGKVPELRGQVQGLLAHVRLNPRAATRMKVRSGQAPTSLGPGLYTEVTLRAVGLGWKGKPDLLTVDDDGSEIVEFKTGERREEHAFQILIYAVLWWRDKVSNPKALPATKLTLAYPDGCVDVPVPGAIEVLKLAEELQSRSNAALNGLTIRPPVARPTEENCGFCEVKQLCPAYWSTDIQPSVQPKAGEVGFADAQVVVTSRHGPASWDATVEASGRVKPGTRLLLRVTTSRPEFHVGDRLRLINLWFGIAAEESAEIKVATVGMQCETYLVT